MQFISVEFLLFLPSVFCAYWLLRRWVWWQNLFVVMASYMFYGWADWRYLGLIAGYTLWSFFSGILIGSSGNERFRKGVLWATVAVNLGVLGLYKYFDFFVDNFNRVFTAFGMPLDWVTLNLVLPVGISFYTFQALSYTVDVYRNKIAPTKDAISFFAFLGFFPQLVAGPIERADTLLPQFQRMRRFDYAKGVEGMKRVLWGIFKKMVIADNCALAVDYIFARQTEMDGFNLLTGAFFFTFQIYGDFSGYSDIAIGCGKLLGIDLMENFRFPYFSRNIKEFWQRWHISLNLWLRDYVYIPLGGNRKGVKRMLFNILVVFAISGLWHGARWTYIGWGLYNGLLIVGFLLAVMLLNSNRMAKPIQKMWWWGKCVAIRKVGVALSVISTFLAVMVGWVVFRSGGVQNAVMYLKDMFDFSVTSGFAYSQTWPVLCYILFFMAVEFAARNRRYALDFPSAGLMRMKIVRWVVFWGLAMATFLLGGEPCSFIYFQF